MNNTMNNLLTNTNSSRISTEIILQKIFIACLLFSLATLTIFGNLLVLYAIRTEKRLRTVSNLFILSLALADLIVGLFVMPLSAIHIIVGHWPFSIVICQMWLSIDYVASTASIFNLILLSLDRYWAVVYPLLYLQTRSRKRAISFIVLIWFLSFLWTPAIIFWSFLIPEHSDIIKANECDTSFRSNKLFKTLTALVNFYLPLLTMIFISCRIMVAIRLRSKMEYGRRISSTTQKQMRRDRTYTNASITQMDHDKTLIKTLSSDEPYEQPITSLEMNNIVKDSIEPSSSIDDQTSFRLSYVKPIEILFPSLVSINEKAKRQSETLPRRYSFGKKLPNSFSVFHNMKYADESTIPKHEKSLAEISSSSSDDGSRTNVLPQVKEQPPLPPPLQKKQLSVRITNPSPSVSFQSHQEISSLITNDLPLTPTNSIKRMNFITFFDYIINPSRSRSLQKELKAARQLGLLVGIFTITWLPYFILFLVVAWCQNCVSENVYTASIWLGYVNSTLNPLIYPLCNKHFRRAFSKIFSCHHAKTKIPNLEGLRELHALHSIRYRR